MLKKFYTILAAAVVSLSAYCESVEKLLLPIRAMEGATCVNVLEHPEMIAEIQQKGGENAEILKSLKKFEVLEVSTSTASIDTLAKQLEDKAGMNLIYNLSMREASDKPQNLFMQLVEQALPLVDHVSMYALKEGDKYTKFVYLIHTPENVNPSNCGVIAYVQGNLSQEQLQYALPKIKTDYSFSLDSPQ